VLIDLKEVKARARWVKALVKHENSLVSLRVKLHPS
jgi:hypothetical protein